MADETSKAKLIRDLLDRSLELTGPDLSPEEFDRAFGIRATPEEIKRFTLAEIMVRQLVLKACKGDNRAITEVLDRLLGKPMQTSESVVKSYSYQDLLLEFRNADAKEKGGQKPTVIDVPSSPALPPPAAAEDIMADFR